MALHNIEVQQTVRFFIQRDCEDTDEARQELKEQLEREGAVDISQQMRGTDMEYEYDLEVTGGPALNGGTE